MQTAYIGIGSNLGNKLNNCLKAIDLMDMTPGCRVKAQSDFFRTEPVGVEDQDWYVNSVISLRTNLSVQQLLEALLTIEKDLGRKRKRKWDPRTIDLDILLFGQELNSGKNLTVPHPLMHERRFVLVPMVQLVPDLIHPILEKSIVELLDALPEERQTVIPLMEA